MKKTLLLLFILTLAAGVAMAQGTSGGDVLGAHNGYGRGCVMCHAPHSGSAGNGVPLATANGDPQNGMYALWGQNLTPLFGKTYNFSGDGQATYPVTLPAIGTISSAHDANTIILFCLSCHDGVTAQVGMMAGQTVETLPIVGGNAPTLLAKAAPTAGAAYNNDHPVGGQANVQCGGGYNWDCSNSGGGNTNNKINPSTGPNMTAYMANNPSSFWNGYNVGTGKGYPLASFGGTTVNAVTCTTCHDQHSMTRYAVNGNTYTTMFFVRGQYTPTNGGNAVAQFCRNCHGGESNEMHGLMNISTW